MSSSTSITKQAAFLMAGRIFALPLAFLVPIILVRYFPKAQFGNYKQLLLLFYLIQPIMDIGISNSLFYFIPKYPEKKGRILTQTFTMQIFMCLFFIGIFFIFNSKISNGLGEGEDLAQYIPYIGIFAAFWHFSTILEIVLIAEKKAFTASVISFLSDFFRSLISISIVIFFNGGLKELLIYGLILTGALRTVLMLAYMASRKVYLWGSFDKKLFLEQIKYALPFGLAVIVTGFVGRSHEFIVTINTNAETFAIYSVGCFQLPMLSIIIDSVAKASMVRMAELTNMKNGLVEITQVISNSIRKLWILFFPAFVFLFINAEEVVILLFTENYRDSIPIFRVFIIMIPINAVLLKHVPRVFAETPFILKNNIFCLAASIVLCLIFVHMAGPIGGAIGLLGAVILWKMVFLIKCRQLLKAPYSDIVPIMPIIHISVVTCAVGVVNLLAKSLYSGQLLVDLIISSIIFFSLCAAAFWFTKIILNDEKDAVITIGKKYLKL